MKVEKYRKTGTGRIYLIFLRGEYIADGFKIAVAVDVVGLEIAHFCPFVPAVDGDQRYVVVLVRVFLCHFQTLPEIFGRIVFHDGIGGEEMARIVVPAKADVREVRHAERFFKPLPFGSYIRQHICIITVNIREMHILIMRTAVKAHIAKAAGGHILAVVHAAQVGGVLIPHGKLQVQPWQVLCFSSENGDGRDQLLALLEDVLTENEETEAAAEDAVETEE